MSLGAGRTFDQESGNLVLDGTLAIYGGPLSQTGGVTALADGGQLVASSIDISGGRVGGAGTIQADVINASEVAPGASPGVLQIVGSYAQSAAGRLITESVPPIQATSTS